MFAVVHYSPHPYRMVCSTEEHRDGPDHNIPCLNLAPVPITLRKERHEIPKETPAQRLLPPSTFRGHTSGHIGCLQLRFLGTGMNPQPLLAAPGPLGLAAAGAGRPRQGGARPQPRP